MDKIFLQVAIKSSFNNSVLTYSYNELLQRGLRVQVPLRNGLVDGIVINVVEDPKSEYLIKDIFQVYEDKIDIDEPDLTFFEWVSHYYHYPLGLLLFEIFPQELKKPRTLKFGQGQAEEFDFELNEVQKSIVEKILNLNSKGYQRHLIHGVTGSGKTVIYLQVIKDILARGKSVLFLLPEINLTPQFKETLTKYLNVKIYTYNSTISNSDKYLLWKHAKESEDPFVILGVRSSIFIPINNLGLIIVDEEHDSSFKQDDRCPYNARDLSIMKAYQGNFPVLLGSATPLVETYFHSKLSSDQTHYHQLIHRVSDRPLPEVELVGYEKEDESLMWPLTHKMVSEIRERLEKKEQVIVFVNRLGYSNFLQCSSCGHEFHCPNCSTTLRYFKSRKELSCYICQYHAPAPEVCPQCSNLKLWGKGFGTEKIESVLKSVFPAYRVERFDRDEIKNQKDLEERLDDFHEGRIDILIGTQMLSKGHNFKKVNLVIILGIDNQLNYPDFRSNERAWQLLKQVIGRAGRFQGKGRVLIQTMNPQNEIFHYVTDQNFDSFYKDEMKIRQVATCPPFSHVAMIYLHSKYQEKVIVESNKVGTYLREFAKRNGNNLEILGPRPGIIEKRINTFTWSIMCKASSRQTLHLILDAFEQKCKLDPKVKAKIDVDPYSLF